MSKGQYLAGDFSLSGATVSDTSGGIVLDPAAPWLCSEIRKGSWRAHGIGRPWFQVSIGDFITLVHISDITKVTTISDYREGQVSIPYRGEVIGRMMSRSLIFAISYVVFFRLLR